MLIDCDSCPARGAADACAGCLVSVLAETPDQRITTAEERAIEVFARAGFEVEVLSAPPAAPVRVVPRSRRGRHVA